MLVSACFSVSKSAQNLAFSLNNLTAGREFSKKLSCPLLPPKTASFYPNPRTSPKTSRASPGKSSRPNPRAAAFPNSSLFSQILGCLPVSWEVLATMRRRVFAARLRQPCGGEGSEGRALAIPRASGAGWAGAWVARPSRRDRPPPSQPRTDGMGLTSGLQRRRARLHQHRAQPSPPKPQPRVAAGPAIRVAEAQWSAGDWSGGGGKVR